MVNEEGVAERSCSFGEEVGTGPKQTSRRRQQGLKTAERAPRKLTRRVEGRRETSHGSVRRAAEQGITDSGVPRLQPTTWHQILASETVTQPALHRRPQRLVRTDANSIPVLCLLGHAQCWAPRHRDSGKGASVAFSRPSSGLEPYSHLDL